MPAPAMTAIEGQLNARERELLTGAILQADRPPRVAVEVGTWLGGGSTLHILAALEKNRVGHLWGIEADPSIYERMLTNLRAAAPELLHRFTPLFGFSQKVLPAWLEGYPEVDFAFLDGGNNPLEQIDEFTLLAPHMPVGARLMSHDAKLRKGRFLVPYIRALDNWESTLHDVSDEGLFEARKIAAAPSAESLRRARRRLRWLRLNPPELAAAILPAGARHRVLAMLPVRLMRRIAEGRK